MTPVSAFFQVAHPDIPIYIAGVNTGLAKLAGEICQGFHVHPFHSVAYINQIVRPQVALGAAKAGRTLQDVQLASAVFVITGPDWPVRAGERRGRTRMPDTGRGDRKVTQGMFRPPRGAAGQVTFLCWLHRQ